MTQQQISTPSIIDVRDEVVLSLNSYSNIGVNALDPWDTVLTQLTTRALDPTTVVPAMDAATLPSTANAFLTASHLSSDLFNAKVCKVISTSSADNADYFGTDQTPFLQALLAMPLGGNLVVLPGTYTFTAPVSVSTPGVRIIGTNPNTVNIVPGDFPAFTLSGSSQTIERVMITGTNVVSSPSILITGDRNLVEMVRLKDFALIGAAANGNRNTIRYCRFESATGRALYLQGTQQQAISCSFTNTIPDGCVTFEGSDSGMLGCYVDAAVTGYAYSIISDGITNTRIVANHFGSAASIAAAQDFGSASVRYANTPNNFTTNVNNILADLKTYVGQPSLSARAVALSSDFTTSANNLTNDISDLDLFVQNIYEERNFFLTSADPTFDTTGQPLTGYFTWDGSNLTWPAFNIVSIAKSMAWTIASGSIAVKGGEAVVLTLNRTTPASVTPTIKTVPMTLDNSDAQDFVLAYSPVDNLLVWAESGRPLGFLSSFDIQGYPLPIARFIGVSDPRNTLLPFSGFAGATNSNLTDKLSAQSAQLKTLVEETNIKYMASSGASITSTVTISSYYGAELMTGLNGSQPTHYVAAEGSTYCMVPTGADVGLYRFHRDASAWYKIPFGPVSDLAALAPVNSGVGVLDVNGGISIYVPSLDLWEFQTPTLSPAISVPFAVARSTFRATGQADYSTQTEDYSLFRTLDDQTIVYRYRDNTLTRTLTPIATDLPSPLGYVTHHYKDTGYTVTLDPDTLYSHSLSNGYSEVMGLPPDHTEGRIVLNPDLIVGLSSIKWETFTIENFSYEPTSTQIMAVYTDGSGSYYLFTGALNTTVTLASKITLGMLSSMFDFTPTFWMVDAAEQKVFVLGHTSSNQFTAVTYVGGSWVVDYQDVSNTCLFSTACTDVSGLYVLSSTSSTPIFYRRVGGLWSKTTLGSAWSAFGLGSNRQVFAIAFIGSDVYAGGEFTTIDGVAASRIAKWNGSTWSSLGVGCDNAVQTLKAVGTDLYVGGWFSHAGGLASQGIAKWNTLTSTWSALGTGTLGYVMAIEAIGTNIYVGGSFSSVNGVYASNIAKWNTTTSTWTEVVSGVNETVNALAVIGTDLYVGGAFTSPVGYIGKCNTLTNSWTGGSGPNWNVTALAASGTDLYVGGSFNNLVLGGKLAKLATVSWAWTPVNAYCDGSINCLAVLGTDLYVGGFYNHIGGIASKSLSKWNGSVWANVGDVLYSGYGTVNVIAVNGTNSYVGGSFTDVGGVSANNLIKYATLFPAAVIAASNVYGVAGNRYVAFLGQDVSVGHSGYPVVWTFDKTLSALNVLTINPISFPNATNTSCARVYGAAYDTSTQTFHWLTKSGTGRITHFCYSEYAQQFSFVEQPSGTDFTGLPDLPVRSANNVGVYSTAAFSPSSPSVSGVVYFQTTDRGFISSQYTLSTSTWLTTSITFTLPDRKTFKYGTSAFSQYPQNSFYPLGALADVSTRMDLAICVGQLGGLTSLPGASASLYGGGKVNNTSDRNAPLFADPGIKVRNIDAGLWFGINRVSAGSGMLWFWESQNYSAVRQTSREYELKRLSTDRGDATVSGLYPISEYDVQQASDPRIGVVFKNSDPAKANQLAFLLITPISVLLEYPPLIPGSATSVLTSEPKITFVNGAWHVVATANVGGVNRLVYWKRTLVGAWTVEVPTGIIGSNPCKPIAGFDGVNWYVQLAMESTVATAPIMYRNTFTPSSSWASISLPTGMTSQFYTPILTKSSSSYWLFGKSAGGSAGILQSANGTTGWNQWLSPTSYESLLTTPVVTTGSNYVVVAGSTASGDVGVWKFTNIGVSSAFNATPRLETPSGEEETGFTGLSFTYDGKLLYSAVRPTRTNYHWSMRISYNNWDSLGESLLGPARGITVGYDHFRECWCGDQQDLITWLKATGLQSQRWHSLPVATYKDDEFLALTWPFQATSGYLFQHGSSPTLSNETSLPYGSMTACSGRRWPLITGSTTNKGGSGAGMASWGELLNVSPPVGVSNTAYFGVSQLTGAGDVLKASTQGALSFNGTHQWTAASNVSRTMSLTNQQVVFSDFTPDKSVLCFEFAASPTVLSNRAAVLWSDLNYPTDIILFELVDYQSGKFIFRRKAFGGSNGRNWLNVAWEEPREFSSFMDARWWWSIGCSSHGFGIKKVFDVTPLDAQAVKIKEINSLHGVQKVDSGCLIYRTDVPQGELFTLMSGANLSENVKEGITVVADVNTTSVWPEDFTTL